MHRRQRSSRTSSISWLNAVERCWLIHRGLFRSTSNHYRTPIRSWRFFARLQMFNQLLIRYFRLGEIWLDTSAVLPLFAESLVSESEWRFTHTLMAASDVGLKLRISSGVIEELERHMNRAYVCSVTPYNQWNGYVPFLYSYYIQTGAPGSQFNTWLENFRGHVRPEDDIAEYLHEKFHIERGDIAADAKSVDPLLRNAVFEAWHDIHAKRREASRAEFDSMLTHRLANHDTDNYVGVFGPQKRRKAISFWLLIMVVDDGSYGVRF